MRGKQQVSVRRNKKATALIEPKRVSPRASRPDRREGTAGPGPVGQDETVCCRQAAVCPAGWNEGQKRMHPPVPLPKTAIKESSLSLATVSVERKEDKARLGFVSSRSAFCRQTSTSYPHTHATDIVRSPTHPCLPFRGSDSWRSSSWRPQNQHLYQHQHQPDPQECHL